jgi:hypothetical protein
MGLFCYCDAMDERASDGALVVLDERMRAPLAKFADRKQYLVHREANGRIVLDPAVTLTEAELQLRDDAGFWARVAELVEAPTTPFELPG